MTSILRLLVLLLLVAVTMAVAHAQEDRTFAEVGADHILEVVAGGDDAKLEAELESAKVDAWVVADELCRRGEHDLAARLAELSEGPLTARLGEYVAARREQPVSVELRDRFRGVVTSMVRGDNAAALELLAELEPTPTDTVPGTLLLLYRGQLATAGGDTRGAHPYFAAAGDSARTMGWLHTAWNAHGEAGRTAWMSGDHEAFLVQAEHGLEVAEIVDQPGMVPSARGRVGIALYRLRRYDEAESTWKAALADLRAVGAHAQEASVLGNLGNLYLQTGEFESALVVYREATEIGRRLGSPAAVAHHLALQGKVHSRLDDLNAARAAYEEALPLARGANDAQGIHTCLSGLAMLERRLGRQREALPLYEEALAASRGSGWLSKTAGLLADIAAVHRRFGDSSRALAYLRESLPMWESIGDDASLAFVHWTIADVHLLVGEIELARKHADLAVSHANKSGLSSRQIKARIRRAEVLHREGRHEAALADLEEAQQAIPGGDTSSLLLLAIAESLMHLERPEHALAIYDRLREDGDSSLHESHPGTGKALMQLGRWDDARTFLLEARKVLADKSETRYQVDILLQLAGVEHTLENDARSIAAADEALAALRDVFSAQTDDGGGRVRSQWSGEWATPMSAALRSGDVASLCRWLEATQAGTLLEALGGRERLQSVAVSPRLARREVDARAEERAARVRHSRAVARRGSLKEVRAARDELAAASAARAAVVAEIQRERRGAAGLVYPSAASIEELQGVLRPDEAFVHWAHLRSELTGCEANVALVVTPNDVRAVTLGAPDLARAAGLAVAELLADAGSSSAEIDGQLAVLRKELYEPLKLGQDVKRVLITAREFSMSPLALVDPSREVVYVPSGSTYVALCEDREKKGEGVLGLGDPDYSVKERETIVAANRAGKLLPLPGTREEVEAVADVKLLGKDATEEGLREALEERERWRSIHLACHGLAPDGGGILSSLAISIGDEDDGNLTAQEILMLDAPADLVALSACETGRGKNYAGEGVVGLPRAFMVAGASRVLCSLWKVDDQATRELMVKFYEEWKTKPAATALRNAQAYVRKQEKWSHPYFWAAWQLWGLPD